MPGEKRAVTAPYPRKLLDGAQPGIRVDGWNLAPASFKPSLRKLPQGDPKSAPALGIALCHGSLSS
jgi:hypothetical protein